MAEFSENEVKSQEVPLTGTDPLKAIRKKVSDAIAATNHGPTDWNYPEIADAAIAAHLEALEQMELPEAVTLVAECAFHHPQPTDIEIQESFRAICAALRSPKTGGESHE